MPKPDQRKVRWTDLTICNAEVVRDFYKTLYQQGAASA